MSRITIPEMEATGHTPESGFSKLMLLAESATMRLSVGHRKNDLTDMVTTKKGASVYLVYNAELKAIPAFGKLDNGLDMTSGLGEAIDDVELEGCVIGQLQDAVSFVRNNSRKKWWKENDYREELPDYPERAVTEAIANAIIHRDYMQMGSEIHIDMYDDRLEIYLFTRRNVGRQAYSTVKPAYSAIQKKKSLAG